jgi:hypothetical protein
MQADREVRLQCDRCSHTSRVFHGASLISIARDNNAGCCTRIFFKWDRYLPRNLCQHGIDPQLGVRADACHLRTSGLVNTGRRPLLNGAWSIRIVIPDRQQEAGDQGHYAIEPQTEELVAIETFRILGGSG